MISLDFDIIGILFFLWVVFSGVIGSQKSKKAKEEKAKQTRNKKGDLPSEPQQKQKPQMPKAQNPFERLMESLKEMEENLNKPEPPPKARPVKKNVSPMEEQFDAQMQDIGDMRTELEKKVALEKKQFEDEFTQGVDRGKDLINKSVNKQKDQIRDVIKEGEQEWKSQDTGLELSRQAVVNGIIWSEILQPPRAQNKFKNNLMRK